MDIAVIRFDLNFHRCVIIHQIVGVVGKYTLKFSPTCKLKVFFDLMIPLLIFICADFILKRIRVKADLPIL